MRSPCVGLSLALAVAFAVVSVGASRAGARPTQLAVTISITGGPEGTVTTTTAVFSFTASVRTATFTCSLDGAPLARCASPVTYSGLANGDHTFLVTAAAGRERASARRLWTVAASQPTPPFGQAQLLVTVDGGGTVTGPGIACPGDCAEAVPAGSSVALAQKVAPAYAFAGWAGACTGTGACTPTVEGTTVVSGRFRLTARPAPRGRTDHDRDRVVDVVDACSSTPSGAKLIRNGCAVEDLVSGGDGVIRGLVSQVGAARERLTGLDGLAQLGAGLTRNLQLVRRGTARFEDDEICAGTVLARRGTRGIVATARAGDALIARLQAQVRTSPAGPDADTKELEWAGLQYRRRLLDEAADQASAVGRALGAACAALDEKVVLEGRITETRDAVERVRLDDGIVVAVGRGTPGAATMWEGGRVRMVARRSRGGPPVADSVSMLDGKLAAAKLTLPCIRLLIAPAAQDFLDDPTPVLHETTGYRWGGILWLEQGMRVAASPTCAGAKNGRYSLQVVMDRPGAPAKTVAADLDGADAPVALPVGGAAVNWKLTVIERFQGSDCAPPQASRVRAPAASTKSYPCPVQPRTTTTYTVRVLGPGTYGTAVYSATALPVEDNGFGLTKVVAIAPRHPSIPVGVGFAGEAYKVSPTQIPSSFETVSLGEEFAVLPDDWYDVEQLFALDTIGVDHLAGVVWPRLVGTRNGAPFAYRAKLPKLLTDVLPGCPTANCLYRLPWKGGGTEKTVQGNSENGPKKSHKVGEAQEFAFDFKMPKFTPILVARGGLVGDVVETNTINANWCDIPGFTAPNNYVRIDHQDGTFSYYAHMMPGSVLPEVGDVVKRGTVLAVTGDIGRACGAHLHYQVSKDNTKTLWGQTIPICFEGAVAFPLAKAGFFPCFVPVTDDLLVSSNAG
jgi:Peptidase family M23